jgi:hypothetical protein
MTKVWLTLSELRQLIREELPSLHDDWASMIPDDAAKPPVMPSKALGPERPVKSVTPKSHALPRQVQRRVELRPSGRIKSMSPVKDPTASKPYTRAELAQGADVTGDEPSEVMPPRQAPSPRVMRGGDQRSRYVAKRRPQAYTREELAQGLDFEPTKPGVMDRLKNMFLRRKG